MHMLRLSDLKLNEANPRVIKDDKFKKLVESIKSFPQMMELRPIVVDEMNVIQGGNMRYRALVELGYKEVPEGWVKQGKELTPEQWREFVIKDNVGFGEWDFDLLANDWDAEELQEWGLDLPVSLGTIDPKDLSNQLKETFEVIISCTDETHQEQVSNKMIGEGYECRVLTL